MSASGIQVWNQGNSSCSTLRKAAPRSEIIMTEADGHIVMTEADGHIIVPHEHSTDVTVPERI